MNKTSIYGKQSDRSCRLGRATAKPNRYNIVVGLKYETQPTKFC
ncbi:hypothetical protein [Hydrocoleum sp. CS-953]|nr:hypothetical protein [Hydrocoleum sp. CS-953]